MNGRSAVVATVVVFKWLDELLEVELLVYLDQKMLGVDEVTHPLGGELEEPRVSAVAVQLIEHFIALIARCSCRFKPTACPSSTQVFQQSDCPALVKRCRSFRPGRLGNPTAAAKYALRSLACRCRQLSKEIQDLKAELERLTQATAPALVKAFGIGPDTAAALLIAAGSNPDRLNSEAAFASLCGVSPVPASSGKTNRHRLNRGGDRQANAALYRIVVVRLRYELRTQAYMCRRTAEGMSKIEVIRCLKRYVAREVYSIIRKPAQILDTAA